MVRAAAIRGRCEYPRGRGQAIVWKLRARWVGYAKVGSSFGNWYGAA